MKAKKLFNKSLALVLCLAMALMFMPVAGLTVNATAPTEMSSFKDRAIVPTDGIYIESVGIGTAEHVKAYYKNTYDKDIDMGNWSAYDTSGGLIYVTVNKNGNDISASEWGIRFGNSEKTKASIWFSDKKLDRGEKGADKCTLFMPAEFLKTGEQQDWPTEDNMKQYGKFDDVAGTYILTAGTSSSTTVSSPYDFGSENESISITISGNDDGPYTVSYTEPTTIDRDMKLTKDYTVQAGDSLTIDGSLTVPTGTTLTVAKQDSSNGTINVNGKLTVDKGDTESEDGKLAINGKLQVYGYEDGTATLENGGQTTIAGILESVGYTGKAYLYNAGTIEAKEGSEQNIYNTEISNLVGEHYNKQCNGKSTNAGGYARIQTLQSQRRTASLHSIAG